MQLLVGPAAPTAHDAEFYYRYSKEMLSTLRPQFINSPPEAFAKAEKLLSGPKATTTATLRALAVAPLKPVGQPGNNHLGFFEHGFFTMASITFFGILPIVGYSSFIAARKGLELALRWRH